MYKYLIKRNAWIGLLVALAAACLIAAELYAMLSSAATANYEISSLQLVMQLTEIAIGLLIFVFIFGSFLKGSFWMVVFDVLRFVAIVCICLSLYMVLSERATLMGYLWFSTLETGNVAAELALEQGVISCGLYLAALLFVGCSGLGELVDAKKRKMDKDDVLAEIKELQEKLKEM